MEPPTKDLLPGANVPLPESPVTTAEPDEDQANARKSTELTALRAHYLKKTLVGLEFNKELNQLFSGEVSTLSYLGPPFTPPPKNGRPPLDFPFLRFIFRQCVLTFPFLAAAPADFFPKKVQPFMTSFFARNISSADYVMDELDENGADPEIAARQKMLAKVEKNLSFLLGSSTKLVEKEEVVRLTQRDLDRLALLARKREARLKKVRDAFDVNVICVRHVLEKGKVRRRVHEEFIIRTRRAHQPDVFVSRRYGDFKTLADELRKAHPQEEVPHPPLKDRTTVTLPSSATQSAFSPPVTPISSPSASVQLQRSYTVQSTGDEVPSSPAPSHTINASKLAREKNRLTLRAYIHTLLSYSRFASSPVLKSFLLSGPTKLKPEEVEDARRREEADALREEGKKKFATEIATRVDNLRGAVKTLKGNMMGKGGLAALFATIKATPHVRQLPPEYKAVLEWGRVSLAATIFQNFVASDSASETLAGLKRIHGQMPYFMLKGVLKISNPPAMIRAILDLFLAQPFGGKSLLQRMFTSSMAEEAKALQEDIAAVQEKIDDPVLCEKIKRFIEAPKDIQNLYKADAVEEKTNLINVILRAPEAPSLDRAQMLRISKANRAYTEYQRYRKALADSDDDDGPQNDDAWLFEDLTILAKLLARLKDRQQLMALIFEGTTAELLKDIITIFYSPLAQVYKAASISDSLGDLQNFLDDLIRTVQKVEIDSHDDPSRTVQTFVDLVQRHEQAFYSFVHKVHDKGDKLFDALMKWIELFLTLIREGLGAEISLEFLLPDRGSAREDIMKEVDAVALYHYRLKVAHEAKIRKRFQQSDGSGSTGEDDVAQALVDGVVQDLSFGELVHGAVADMEAEVSSEEDETSEEYETASEDSDSGSGSGSEETDSEETDEVEDIRGPRTSAPNSRGHGGKPSLDLTSSRRPTTLRPSRSMTLPHSAPATNSSFQLASPPPPTPALPAQYAVHASTIRKPTLPYRGHTSGGSSPTSSTPTTPSPLGRDEDSRTRRISQSSSTTSSRVPSNRGSPAGSPRPSAEMVKGTPRVAGDSTPARRVKELQKLSIPQTPSTASNNSVNHSRIGSGQSVRRPLPLPRKKKPRVDDAGQGIEPPELKSIPELLPLFLELMRPLLRPRAL